MHCLGLHNESIPDSGSGVKGGGPGHTASRGTHTPLLDSQSLYVLAIGTLPLFRFPRI